MSLGTALRRLRPLRAVVLAGAALAGFASAASATWSIVLVDTTTGEVALGCATCLENFDLELWVPVMVVGVGGACSQSSIDSDGRIRRTIWDGLHNGEDPKDILKDIQLFDNNFSSRQIGIVDMQKRKQSFTGRSCGAFAGGVTGRSGQIFYAIQGNVLTGQPVVDQAEQAILNTAGDLAEKLMAGMEAAASMGGDGRCSCSPSAPDSCGSPPPGFDPSVDKSAHCGFMMISRIGDSDGDCNVNVGCSTGSYYLNLNIANQTKNDPDPVVQLRGQFDAWRAAQAGRPDHLLTQKALAIDHLPGNGTAATTLDLTAIDWQGIAVGHGGATVTVKHAADSAGLARFGTVVDHGDGTYSVPVTAGTGQGLDRFEVVVDDGLGPVTLYPFPTLDEQPTLTGDVASISAGAGGTVNFAFAGPAETPPPGYLLLCSASGTSPGFPLCSVVVPLNLDAVVFASYALRNSANFVNTDGRLFADGTQSAQFVAKPGELAPAIGFDLAFAYFTHGPVLFASNPVTVTVTN